MLTAANGKTLEAKLVFSRSLKYFYYTAKYEIPRGSGETWVDDEVKWILTVPAIWGDRAKAFMIEAAKDVSCSSVSKTACMRVWTLEVNKELEQIEYA